LALIFLINGLPNYRFFLIAQTALDKKLMQFLVGIQHLWVRHYSMQVWNAAKGFL
jgi:hypothetical protein